MTKIFDSLVHADPSLKDEQLSKWISEHSSLQKKSGIYTSMVMRMDSERKKKIDSSFAIDCKNAGLFPMALVSPHQSKKELIAELKQLASLGYTQIKLHPRHDKFEMDNRGLRTLFEACAGQNLTIGLCCYLGRAAKHVGADEFLDSLADLMDRSPETKVVLYHGGGVELLRFAEYVRPRSNVILDLSFTVLKFRGSSIDLDLKFLFEKFDKRICVGSDFPDFTYESLANRVVELSAGIDSKKIERISSANLEEFLGVATSEKRKVGRSS